MIAQGLHLALAVALAYQAVMLLHRAIPRVIDARGPWQAWCHVLLAGVLILGFQPLLERAIAGAEINGWRIVRDALLLAYAFCRYRRAIAMSDATWASKTGKAG